MKKYLLALFLLTAFQGCAVDEPAPSLAQNSIDAMTAHAALRREEIPAGSFILTTYSRIGDANAPVSIYIEGEDRPYAYTAAIELTPTHPVGLELAALDPSANVVYIGRPCQFTAFDTACNPDLIKNGRFSQQVIVSVNRAIDHFVVPLNQPRIHLVGYGSGGAVAALIAAKRQQKGDVVSLRTVAGNMDPYGLVRYEGYDGADDLIDPMPIARRLTSLPQEHFVGGDDMVIPAFITANFVILSPVSHCSAITTVEGVTHDQGWEKVWRRHATDIPVCGKGY